MYTDNVIHAIVVKKINMIGSVFTKKYKIAKPFIILKSIKYEIGLKYPEYRPCLNKLKLWFYVIFDFYLKIIYLSYYILDAKFLLTLKFSSKYKN